LRECHLAALNRHVDARTSEVVVDFLWRKVDRIRRNGVRTPLYPDVRTATVTNSYVKAPIDAR